MKIYVLLAEDEPLLGKIIKETLESRDFLVEWTIDGVKAFSKFKNQKFDICVLDVMMPLKDGFSLAKEIRAVNKDIPILFLTAKSTTEDVIEGFNAGANDYLKKPFSMEELIIRMRHLTKNLSYQEIPETETVVLGEYSFNFKKQTLLIKGETIELSYKEAMLLKMLYENKNDVLDRTIALELIWGTASMFNARSMDVYITKLRKYLNEDPQIKIINIRGIGYKLLIES
ncbi:response regulator transcription factor [Gynurincola endophyticus]|uniref:response regulator transcription factor n=1 Tax=Gynurincola endophyticus TaxID=2479004 RepID=UPI000F8EEFF2|nr:response regulator transcription factor [Gynurincola endophyticus]